MSGPESSERQALAQAAREVARGVAAYVAGDLAGAQGAFEEALRLWPSHRGARQFLAWVQDLRSGARRLDASAPTAPDVGELPEVADALQAIADALGPPSTDDPPTPGPRGGAPPESPWDPVPLTPGRARPPAGAPPPAPRALGTLPGLQVASKLVPHPAADGSAGLEAPFGMVDDGPGTPAEEGDPRLDLGEEPTRSLAPQWRAGVPTSLNLPQLDVPELTDQQIQELLALDQDPALDPPLEAHPARRPTLQIPALSGVAPSPIPVPALGPTVSPSATLMPFGPLVPPSDPAGHPSPEGGYLELTADAEDEVQPGPTPGLGAPIVSGFDDDDERILTTRFNPGDAFEMSPTMERVGVAPPAVPTGQAELQSDPSLPLTPLELQAGGDAGLLLDGAEVGPLTNIPFVPPKLADHGPPRWSAGAVAEPRSTMMGHAVPLPAGPPTAAIEAALARADAPAAFEVADGWLRQVGGCEGEAARREQHLLERVFIAALGALDRVPRHGVPSLDLDPREAFLLSRLDGMSTVEDLLEVSGMPRLAALHVLAGLVRRGVIAL